MITRLEGSASASSSCSTTAPETTLGEAFLDDRFAAEARAVLSEGVAHAVPRERPRVRRGVRPPGAAPDRRRLATSRAAGLPLAKVIGYRTAVLDGRPRFATRERFPDVDELRVGIPSQLVA